MFGDSIAVPDKIKEALTRLNLAEKSVNGRIKTLVIEEQILSGPINSKGISDKLNERFGITVPVVAINKYMKTFQQGGICVGINVKNGKAKKKVWLGSWVKTKKVFSSLQSMDTIPISVNTVKALGKKFTIEMNALHLVYGRDGDCTAFILRKILEKSIFLAFAKNGILNKLEDPAKKPKYYGLDKMIEVASTERGRDNKPYITPSVAAKLGGVKFLGDSAAHNFLTNVEIDEIPHQMPYISTALSELTKKMKIR